MKKRRRCIVCNSSQATTLFQIEDKMFNVSGLFTVRQCKQCSLVFIDPQPSQKILKRHYPSSHYYSYQSTDREGFFDTVRTYLLRHYYRPSLLSRFISIVIKNVPAIPSYKTKGKVLDVGCGIGDTLEILAELGWEPYGLEIDKKAVAIAKKKGLSRVRLGSHKDIRRYPNNYFDAVRLYHVIEHIDDPRLCLRLIYRKLKKGGELIIGTPNYHSFARFLFGNYWYNLDVPRHLFIFSPDTLQRMFLDIGFTDLQAEYCSAGGIVGSLQYILPKIAGRKMNLLNQLWLVLLFYPLEWILDKIHIGDVFVIRARK